MTTINTTEHIAKINNPNTVPLSPKLNATVVLLIFCNNRYRMFIYKYISVTPQECKGDIYRVSMYMSRVHINLLDFNQECFGLEDKPNETHITK
jgi:hypothetical protein